MFSWLKNRRRRQLLDSPMPDGWQTHLESVRFFRLLPPAQQARLRDLVRIFVAEKTWEGCRGLVVTEEMQVTIAAQACLLVLGMDDYCFDGVQTLLIYPREFVARVKSGLTEGTYLEGEREELGEAHYRGPVILSWAEIQADLEDPGHGTNLVIHEFAHQLDMLNGEADGVPVLPAELTKRWQTVMAREYDRLCRQVDRGDESSVIDPYGATDHAEFFAVVSECFFDAPLEMKEERPKLYALLRDFYRQDPASWHEGDIG